MKTLANKTVLITGGAMGVGKLFAQKCIHAGARVILWDINIQALRSTLTELKTEEAEVYSYIVDISDVTSIENNARQVLNDFGVVDIVFNNAGIVIGTDFVKHTTAQIERTIRINTLGVMHVARLFLPAMIQQGHGHLINMASASGYLGNPSMSVYAGSKWAVIGWSESVRLEMKKAGLKNIHVTTVTPSYIDTGMFAGVKAPLLTPILQPAAIVEAIWQGMLKGKAFVRAPWIVNVLPLLRRILPSPLFDLIVGEWFGVYRSMDTFKGRGRQQAVNDLRGDVKV